MGTLFEQEARKMYPVEKRHLLDASDMIIKISQEKNLDPCIVAELYKTEVLNRYITCYVNNGNIFDEQMAGIGKILQNISDSVAKIAENDAYANE